MLQPPVNPFHAELQAGVEAARKILASLSIQVQVMHIAADSRFETAEKIRGLSAGRTVW